jgi:hypothetical protein
MMILLFETLHSVDVGSGSDVSEINASFSF